MNSRKIISTALLAALPLALAACSSSKSGSADAASTPAPGPPSPSAAKQLTGVQLTAALLAVADLPGGYSVDSTTVVNSGSALTTADAKYKLTTLSCGDLENDLGQAGFGETAVASNEFDNAASTELLDQAVYQFSSATAANVYFTSLEAKWNSCGTFTESSSGTTIKGTVTAASAPSGLGDMAFANTTVATATHVTLTGNDLFVLDGVDVFIVGPSEFGTTQPTDLSPQKLIVKLMTKVGSAG